MDARDKARTSFQDFKSTQFYTNMNSNQQQALQNVWNAYGSINADNKDKFFNDLNTLVKKPPFPQGKHQINGPVLGQQAYDIKTYINQELGNENPGMVALQ